VFHFFRGLRGKLILTYTLVTVLALLALEVLALLAFGTVGAFNLTFDPDSNGYLDDVVTTLAPQARLYLQPGHEDLPGLQAWLDQLSASGQASPPPQYIGDSPAAALVPGQPLYVLSPQGTVLAQTPLGPGSLVGQAYTPPNEASKSALQSAFAGQLYGGALFARTAEGNDWMAVPVRQQAAFSATVTGPVANPVVGVVIVTITPLPASFWSRVWPAIQHLAPAAVGAVLGTAVVLLIAVAPLGGLFGFVMSRGLTRRLATLSAAADAWSEGNFTPLPPERGVDEISVLGQRLRRMAERLQTLLQTQQQLAALEERNRLARELHDTVKQQSFATLMQLRAARNLLDSEPAVARQHLAEAEELVKTSQQDLGRLITELRPAELEGQGLPVALRDLVNNWAQQTRIPATCQIQNERRLPLDVEQALYRVAQEALANVARHSRASAATVRLAYAPGAVTLVVSDNGVGFNPAAAPAGFGLQSMQQRLSAVGGQLTVVSAPDSGATLTATIPVSE
jgi:two-component system, NarL family, sensor histidine kinase LiaS